MNANGERISKNDKGFGFGVLIFKIVYVHGVSWKAGGLSTPLLNVFLGSEDFPEGFICMAAFHLERLSLVASHRS